MAERRDAHFGKTFAWDTDLLSGYEHAFVLNQARQPDVTRFSGLHNPCLRAALLRWAPDAILLFGYAHRTHLKLILRPPAPLIFRGDSHLLGEPTPSWYKRFALRLLYRRFAAVTYVGQANRAYFRAFGVPDAKLFFAPHCVDASHFIATPQRHAEADVLRKQLNLGGKKVVLFAGKLVPAKQPRELLEAFISLAPTNSALVFVGDGPEKTTLVSIATSHPGLSIHFLPFANQSAMPSRYLLADIFALPSRGRFETWGLAVNEAMHMGVPCLVSDRVGCQQDLVTDGETGWVFKAENLTQLRTKLAVALSANHDAMRPAIATRINQYSYSHAATGLLAAVSHAVGIA